MKEPKTTKELARIRAARNHQGNNHWHVERRTSVIICGNCGVKIPKWKNPQYCPDCETGKEHRSRTTP